jgi:glycosyltransferase involved in cell wall biosynthesis
MTGPPELTLVVNTYEQPEFLRRVLKGVASQTEPPDELILADDGSSEETALLFDRWGSSQAYATRHVWQEHKGFRRARILNVAIAQATKHYLVFIDGDSVPHPSFIADHRRLAKPQTFVQGHRAFVQSRAGAYFGLNNFSNERRRALLSGQIRGVKYAYRWPFPLCKYRKDLRGIRGCNLAIWRKDLMNVNGYNEAFVGWGREDSELALRLLNNNLRRLDVRGWALCYHLWHAPANRDHLPTNERLLQMAMDEQSLRAEKGLDGHQTPRSLSKVGCPACENNQVKISNPPLEEAPQGWSRKSGKRSH